MSSFIKVLFTPLLVMAFLCTQAQFKSRTDTTNNRLPTYRATSKMYLSVGKHLMYGTSSPTLNALETQILDLEDKELNALLKRDFLALTTLWVRDFSRDHAPTDEIVNSNSTLPNYSELSRIVENLSVTDSAVYTRGREHFRIIGTGTKLKETEWGNFIHIWSKKSSTWKLTARIHSRE